MFPKKPPKRDAGWSKIHSAGPPAEPANCEPACGAIWQKKLHPPVTLIELNRGSQRSAVLLNTRPGTQVLNGGPTVLSKVSENWPVNGPVATICAPARL